jgi:hypothetical protein
MLQPPDFALVCAVCGVPISHDALRTTAGSAEHSSGVHVIVHDRACFERLRRSAPLLPYSNAGETFRSMRAQLAVVGNGIDIGPSQIAAAGNGVFATRDFPKGAPITEYIGLVISNADARRLRDEGKSSHMLSMFHMGATIDGMYTPEGVLITDPRSQLWGRGAGAYANDARDLPGSALRNNATLTGRVHDAANMRALSQADALSLNPRGTIGFARALRDIYAGDEVFVSYGHGYWLNASASAAAAHTRPASKPKSASKPAPSAAARAVAPAPTIAPAFVPTTSVTKSGRVSRAPAAPSREQDDIYASDSDGGSYEYNAADAESSDDDDVSSTVGSDSD